MSMSVVPSHRVPPRGMPAWTESDATLPPAATLDPGLEVQVVSRWGDWANIRCTNGWMAWVDGRKLEPLTATASAPAATASASATRSAAPATGGRSLMQMLGASRPAVIGGRTVEVGAAMVGAALVAIGSLLDWFSATGLAASSFDVKVNFLFNPKSLPSGPDLGLFVIALAIGFAVLSLMAGREREQRGVAIAVIAIGVLFVVQMQRWLAQFPEPDRPDLFGTVGFGVYVTILGGALMLVRPARGPA